MQSCKCCVYLFLTDGYLFFSYQHWHLSVAMCAGAVRAYHKEGADPHQSPGAAAEDLQALLRPHGAAAPKAQHTRHQRA